MQYKYNTIYCCLLSFFILVAGLAMIFFFLGPSRSGSYTLSVFVRLDILYSALPSSLDSTLCLHGVGLLLLLLSSTLLSCTIMNIETPPPSVKMACLPTLAAMNTSSRGECLLCALSTSRLAVHLLGTAGVQTVCRLGK